MPIPIILLVRPDLVAQAATEAGPWLTLANLGVGGIFLWAFTTGKIHSDKELQRVISRCDADFQRVVENNHNLTEELRTRNREAMESLVPTLTRAVLLLSRFVDSTPPPPSKGRM